jgi:arylsulfatase A-like enzyme
MTLLQAMLKSLAILWLGLTAALGAATRPNVVLILADDLGYGDLSCQGQKHFATPRLDRMAAEGLRFTRHYAGSTVCAPSRCSLLTGRDTGHSGLRANGSFALRPDPADLTVATLLREAGYDTALIGKSCVTGNTQTPATLAAKGFREFYGTTSHKDGHFRFPKFIYQNERRIELPGNTLHAGPHYDLTLYQNHALAWLDRRAERPFFLVLSLPLPHASLVAPEEALARVRPGVGNEPAEPPPHGHYTEVKEVKAAYAAMVTLIDDTVGKLIDKLRERGLDDNTLVIFTSDNGSHAEGGYHYAMLDSNGGLRGGKRDLYEGGIRVPMILRWPAAGERPCERVLGPAAHALRAGRHPPAAGHPGDFLRARRSRQAGGPGPARIALLGIP